MSHWLRRSIRANLPSSVLIFGLSGCASNAPPSAVAASGEPVAPRSVTAFGAGVPRAIPANIPFVSLEGPFWVRGGNYLLFSDVVEENGEAAKIYRYDPASGLFSVFPYPQTPTSTNGLAVTSDGKLYACERWNGALARIVGNARHVIVDRSPTIEGSPLNAPNDLAIRSDGNVYFSDTTWGSRPGPHATTGVYRVAPNGTVSMVFLVDMPNGVALSPDGTTLYVGSDKQNRIWALPVAPDGSVGTAKLLVSPEQVPDGRFDVPDGICVDDLGRIYATNNSNAVSAIQVFGPEGGFVGSIPIPQPPSNCTFGGQDRRSLFVTTLHAIYEVRMETPGLP